MLKVYNDLTNCKEDFEPLEPGRVSMYVCGMTVYDLCHLGHARVMVVFDVVYRYLMALGYEVNYVRNITDIDDKIIARANENAEPFTALTERFIDAMHADSEALGVLPPDSEPRASEHIDDIISMIQRLLDRQHAYVADNGDVYYAVNSFANYGKLSGKSTEDLRAGARVAPGEAKRDPLDFALWKSAKPGEPAWDSPWGSGRPGWHIECSAMSTRQLGDTFDIHGGGADLTFPHHENEIAQSEGATGHPFVRYWLHNGFVRINDEKMSKSLGNFFTVREILANYRPEEVRYFILTSHYRSPLNYDHEHLDNARAALTRFYTALRGLPEAMTDSQSDYSERFKSAMNDDFNTPVALSVLFELVRDINTLRLTDIDAAASKAALLKQLGHMLGLLQDDPETFLRGQASDDGLSDEQVGALVAERFEAKQNRDWGRADEIRDQLRQAGILVEDSASGSTWRRA